METALQGAKVWSSELGEFISQSHIILAGMLDDYSQGRFSLAYLPAAEQGAFGQHKPFQIQERREDGTLIGIRDLTHAEVNDPGEVMAWVAFGDIRRRGINTVFEEMEFKRLADEAISERQREEERADRREMIETLASGGRDKKHFFTHNGKTFRR
jgi:hypothetical protein